MHERPRVRIIAYGVPLLSTGASLLLRWPLSPVLGDASPFLTFVPAVILSAYLGGLLPGLVATVLSALAADFFVIEPVYTFWIADPANAVALAIFLLVGTMISVVCESLHRTRHRLVAHERERAQETLRDTEERFRQLAENIREMFWMQEGGWTQTLYVSPTYEEIWGRTCQSLYEEPRSWIDSVHSDDRDMVLSALEQQLRGLSTETVFRVIRPDHSMRWVRCRAFPIKNQSNEVDRIAGLAEDITERKQVEEALWTSEQRFQTFVDHATDAFFLLDEKLVIVDVNRRACDSLGYSRDELVGMTPTDLDADVTRAAIDDIDRRLNSGETITLESRHRRNDGTVFPVEVRAQAFWDGDRRFTVALARDITDWKRAEEALRLSEQRYRSLVEATSAIVWTLPASGLANASEQSSWTAFTGQTNETYTGWGWLDSVHPDDRERTVQVWSGAIAAQSPYQTEYRVRRHDGEYRTMLTRGVPILARNGEVREWFGTCVDITDLKRAEEKLRESEERFRGTFENAAVGIAHLDAQGHCLRSNEQLADIIGYTPTELVGVAMQDVIFSDDLAENLALFEPLMRGDIPSFTMEKRLVRKDGSLVWVYVTVSLQFDAVGKPTYGIAIVQSISERKRLETELRQAKEAAEAANRAKDEFLANVSHEVRTPLNAIIGMTELALDTPLHGDQRQYLKTAKSASESLLDILNDLLDFSKIEAGKLELDPADFSLRAVLRDTLRVLATRAHMKGLELVSHVRPDVTDALIGDAGRLRQVLLNLVGNAIKFTDEGEVVVRVEVAAEPVPDGEVRLQIAVSDTGIGISLDKQETIFRAFEQEDTSTTRKYGGTGLGLTIAARLVALMGGRIGVESETGRGSTFAFSARFGRQPHPPEPIAALPPPLLHNLPVLIVDDNVTNRQILEEWLRGWQMEPAAVGDGMAAMDALWHRAANGQPYALVLLDARMPDSDGLSVAAKIRERAALAATRIILLTSGDRPGDPARFRELRIDAHLLKPVQQDELLETIYQVLSRPKLDAPTIDLPTSATNTAAGLVPATTSMHVLVAEDNDLSAQVMEQLLIRQGHRVQLASNGSEALALAETVGFDLLLLDIHMPELDGFEVVRAIREREQTTADRLPVIALTARSRKEDRERCLTAGMDDFLAKPIRPAELWAAIERVMKTHPLRKPAGLELLDVPVLLAACGSDANLLRKMCQSFQTRIPEHLAALHDALRDQDAPRLCEAAHKFGGLLSEFSTVAGDLAGRLEDVAAGGSLHEAGAILEELETMANELIHVAGRVSLEALQSHPDAGGREP